MKYLTLIWVVWVLSLSLLGAQPHESISLDSNLIIDGKRQGEWVFRYENGNLKAQGFYENGNRIGKWVFYWENGQIQSKGQYTTDESIPSVFQQDSNFEANTSSDVAVGKYPIQTICPPKNNNSELISGAIFEGILDEFTEQRLWAYFDSSGYLIEIIEFDRGVWKRVILPDQIKDP